MKTKIIIAMLSGMFFITLNAQSNKDIKRIDKIYSEVKKGIELSLKEDAYLHESSTFFCNTMEENVYNKTWYVIGIHNFKTQYWYDGIPKFDEDKEKPEECLKIVISKGSHRYFNYYSEYLYDNDGKLILAYLTREKDDDENTITNKLKVYFKNGKPIKKIGDAKHFMSDENIIYSSKNYMKKFVQQLEAYE